MPGSPEGGPQLPDSEPAVVEPDQQTPTEEVSPPPVEQSENPQETERPSVWGRLFSRAKEATASASGTVSGAVNQAKETTARGVESVIGKIGRLSEVVKNRLEDRAKHRERISTSAEIIEKQPRSAEEIIELVKEGSLTDLRLAELEARHGAGVVGKIRAFLAGESALTVEETGQVGRNYLNDIARRVLTSALNRRTLGGAVVLGALGAATGGVGAVAFGSLGGLAAGRLIAELIDAHARKGTTQRAKELLETEVSRWQEIKRTGDRYSQADESYAEDDQAKRERVDQERHSLAEEMIDLYYQKSESDIGKLIAERQAMAKENLTAAKTRLAKMREWLGVAGSLAGAGLGMARELSQGMLEHLDLDLWGKEASQDIGHRVVVKQDGTLRFLYNSFGEVTRGLNPAAPAGALAEPASQLLNVGVAMNKESLPIVLSYLMAEKGLSITAGALATKVFDRLSRGRAKATVAEDEKAAGLAHRQARSESDRFLKEQQKVYRRQAEDEWSRLGAVAAGHASYLPQRPEGLASGWYQNVAPEKLADFTITKLPLWTEKDAAGRSVIHPERLGPVVVGVADVEWSKHTGRWEVVVIRPAKLGQTVGLQPIRLGLEDFLKEYRPGPLTEVSGPREEAVETERPAEPAAAPEPIGDQPRAREQDVPEAQRQEPPAEDRTEREIGMSLEEAEAAKERVNQYLTSHPEARLLRQHPINIKREEDTRGRVLIVPRPKGIILGNQRAAVTISSPIWRGLREKHLNLKKDEVVSESLDLEIVGEAEAREIKPSREGQERRYRVIVKTEVIKEDERG